MEEEIVRRYRAGQSFRFIQFAMDVSRDTVSRVLKENGVRVRRSNEYLSQRIKAELPRRRA